MTFVADECVAQDIVSRLRAEGHDVYAIREQQRGVIDTSVLQLAGQMGRVLLTQDLDFGELVFRHSLPHRGVVLIRLPGMTPAVRAERVAELVRTRAADLVDAFTVLSPTTVRIRPPNVNPAEDPV